MFPQEGFFIHKNHYTSSKSDNAPARIRRCENSVKKITYIQKATSSQQQSDELALFAFIFKNFYLAPEHSYFFILAS